MSSGGCWMAERTTTLLVDTNVWLDLLLGRGNARQSGHLVMCADGCDHLLTVTASQLKDIFYIVGQSLKNSARKEEGTVTQEQAASANEVAWSCLSYVQKQAMVLSEGSAEHYLASSLRPDCADYEDALLLACARNAQVDFIVTNDKQLLGQPVVKALSPAQYLETYA